MDEQCDVRHRQQVRLAIEAAENCTRPRRWLARYGGLAPCRGADATELNKEYRQHCKRIAGSVKPISASGDW
ncbi:MAG TPA: hypothetical protein VFD09_07745 [Thiopseudomonas sp.]|nr:hypothetical protein [Thiopseudomonas sp.]